MKRKREERKKKEEKKKEERKKEKERKRLLMGCKPGPDHVKNRQPPPPLPAPLNIPVNC